VYVLVYARIHTQTTLVLDVSPGVAPVKKTTSQNVWPRINSN